MRSRRRRCRWAQVHHMIRYVSSRRRQRASNAPTKARIHATYATSWGENVLEQRSTATPTSSGDVSGSSPRRREPREHIRAYLSVAVDAAVRLRAGQDRARAAWERRGGCGSGAPAGVVVPRAHAAHADVLYPRRLARRLELVAGIVGAESAFADSSDFGKPPRPSDDEAHPAARGERPHAGRWCSRLGDAATMRSSQ